MNSRILKYNVNVRQDYNGRPTIVELQNVSYLRIHPFYWDDSDHYGRMYRYIPLGKKDLPFDEAWISGTLTDLIEDTEKFQRLLKELKRDDRKEWAFVMEERDIDDENYFVPYHCISSCILETIPPDFMHRFQHGKTNRNLCGFIALDSKIHLLFGTVDSENLDKQNAIDWTMKSTPKEMDGWMLNNPEMDESIDYLTRGEIIEPEVIVAGKNAKYEIISDEEGSVLILDNSN
jgi:hypothetical protein